MDHRALVPTGLIPISNYVTFELKPGLVFQGQSFQEGERVLVIGQLQTDAGPVEWMSRMSPEVYVSLLQKAQVALDRLRERQQLTALTHSRVSGMLSAFYPRQLRR